MRSVESEGESIDAAIEAALKSLGASRDRVEVEILSNASRGLFGIGGRRAKVRATLRQPISEQILEDTAEPEPRPAPPKPSRRTPDQTESTSRPRRDARRSESTAPASTSEAPPAAAAAAAGDALRGIVQHMGVDAEVHARVDGDSIVLELTGDSSGVLIGRKGQMLDALEYLVSRIVSRDQASAAHVVIDCERYRQRRRESLEDLARRMADEAKRKKRVVKLNAMSPRDRRIVHLVLQQDSSITTRSSGKGHFRKLIIVPRGAESTAESAADE